MSRRVTSSGLDRRRRSATLTHCFRLRGVCHDAFYCSFCECPVAGGCQSTVQTQATFNSDEASFIKKNGKGAITGHAFLKRKSGTNVYASGEIVRLTRVTAYSRERFTRLYNGRRFVAALSIPKVDVDPTYGSFTRTAKTDHIGRFRFENVAPGSYYVSSQVTSRERGEYLPSGGAIFEEVTITGKESEAVDVVLSGH